MFTKLNLFLFSLVASLFVQATFAMEQRGLGIILADEDAAERQPEILKITNEMLASNQIENLLQTIAASSVYTSIDVSDTNIIDEQLEAILTRCSDRIETLTCCRCQQVRKLRIICPNLKRLFLNKCLSLQDLYIDCPMLQLCTLLHCPIDIICHPDGSTLLRHQITSPE